MSNWYQQAALAFSDALTIKLCKVMPGMCRYGMMTFPNFVKIYRFTVSGVLYPISILQKVGMAGEKYQSAPKPNFTSIHRVK